MKEREIIKAFVFIVLAVILFAAQSRAKVGFVLGNEEGRGALIFPRQVKEGPDGNIFVYDQKDAFIKVYSPHGEFLRTITGNAEGPGYIKRKDGVTFGFTADNKLFFTEYFRGHPWITFMTSDGKFLRVSNLKPNETLFGVECAVSLADGGFLIEFAFLGTPTKNKNYFLHGSRQELFRINSKGQITSLIQKTNYLTRLSNFKRGGDLAIPFSPRFRWCPFKDDTVIVSDGVSKDLKVLNYKGELVKEIETHLPESRNITGKDLDKWRDKTKRYFTGTQAGIAWYKKCGNVIERYRESIHKKIPCHEDIFATPAGNILITGPWDEDKQGRRFWLLDENGRTQAEIVFDAFPLTISKNFIFVKKSDDESNEYLYCFKRKGEEKQDLLNLVHSPPPFGSLKR